MPDPRAPKKARSGYELFLLAGGIEFQVGNIIIKKVSFILGFRIDCSRWMMDGYTKVAHYDILVATANLRGINKIRLHISAASFGMTKND